MKVVIIGSGATFGTLPDCPLLSGFGKTLAPRFCERGQDWRHLYQALAKTVADSEQRPSAEDEWDLGTVWTRLDYYNSSGRNAGEQLLAGRMHWPIGVHSARGRLLNFPEGLDRDEGP